MKWAYVRQREHRASVDLGPGLASLAEAAVPETEDKGHHRHYAQEHDEQGRHKGARHCGKKEMNETNRNREWVITAFFDIPVSRHNKETEMLRLPKPSEVI